MPPPDRWDAYCPMGKVIPGTKFIAFKVPLKEELMKGVQDEHRFSPAILIKSLEEQGLKLGGVIDLTFTLKYYNKEEFLKESIGHKKIFTKGHDVPSENVFQEFAGAVKTFDEGGHLIGVHCTHGVNRTGYLICRYMIEEMDMEPDEAINLFNEARGHRLERENYLHDLKNRIKGQSTYDPAHKWQEESPADKKAKKPRWRHNRDDHPGWRQRNQSDMDEMGARYIPNNDQNGVEQRDMSFSPGQHRVRDSEHWNHGNPSHSQSLARDEWQKPPNYRSDDPNWRERFDDRHHPRGRGWNNGYQNRGRGGYRDREFDSQHNRRNPNSNYERTGYSDPRYESRSEGWGSDQGWGRSEPRGRGSYGQRRTYDDRQYGHRRPENDFNRSRGNERHHWSRGGGSRQQHDNTDKDGRR